MTKTFKTTLLFFITAFVFSCSQILQSVDLDINTEDDSVQEKFDVIEKLNMLERMKYPYESWLSGDCLSV